MARPKVLVDALEVGRNEKGITRVMTSLIPYLLAELGEDVVVACSPEGAEILNLPDSRVAITTSSSQAVWEQFGLPLLATRRKIGAIYSHRECGAVWGPPLVLHVPEDPEVRWGREPASGLRERARRAYSRRLMHLALRRATIVGASVPSIATDLSRRYGVRHVHTMPLGFDEALFWPAEAPRAQSIFHLGSSDPRDRTLLVLEAYHLLLLRNDSESEMPGLVLGGNLGASLAERVQGYVNTSPILRGRVEITGRLSDAALGAAYRDAALVVQPSSDEGFGLQPLEALASGAPLVVANDASAVLEIVGSAAIHAEATPTGLSRAIERILFDADLARRLRAQGLQRARGYTWFAGAQTIAAALRSAAEGGAT